MILITVDRAGGELYQLCINLDLGSYAKEAHSANTGTTSIASVLSADLMYSINVSLSSILITTLFITVLLIRMLDDLLRLF
jgi:hypothetical protein